ncbi:MAG: peroxidase [Methylobacter sp.]|nr:MAG: peroxidase [Methylobacter sp.]PPD02487.1 MAG: peroxidase [Methylobacter sp.]
MQRIQAITQPEGKAKQLLDGVKQAMGATPNIFTTFANSAAALEAYLGINNALANGVLEPTLREQLAVTIAGYNGCNYCASAHVFLGGKAGIEREELIANSKGKSADAKTQAAIDFARALLEKRGKISNEDLSAVRAAGFSDEEVIEILAHVAMNTFTNYFNETALTAIDFPMFDVNAA